MIGSGMELEQIRRAIADARRARDAAACCGPADSHTVPSVLKSLSELIDVAELLLADRMKMESRLHRTPFSPPPESLQPISPTADRS